MCQFFRFIPTLVAQTVKNLSAMQEMWVQTLGQEDALEKGIATHCSALAWRIAWTQKPGGLQSMGSQRVQEDCTTHGTLSGLLARLALGLTPFQAASQSAAYLLPTLEPLQRVNHAPGGHSTHIVYLTGFVWSLHFIQLIRWNSSVL